MPDILKMEKETDKHATSENRVFILGTGFDPLTVGEASGLIIEIIKKNDASSSPLLAVTPNPLMVTAALDDPELGRILNDAELVLPDGIGIVGAAKRRGTPLPGRCPGIETGEAVIARLAETGRGLFIAGGRPGRAKAAAERLAAKYPGLVISGYADGFDELTDDLPESIAKTGAGLVAVCLGSPKQEKWAKENLSRLAGCGVVICLGGAVDVWSGSIKRAPRAICKMRLEWLWRMLAEPRRFSALPKLLRFRLLTRRRLR